MNGALKVAWGLTAFVVVTGIVGWIATGRAVFAVFLVLGLATALMAFVTGRVGPTSPSGSTGTPPSPSKEENP